MKNQVLALGLLAVAATAVAAPTKPVEMKAQKRSIPTYPIGAPEVDPMFFNGRVYQGAEGYIYPYALYDQLTDKRVDKEYNELCLGNEWVDISVMPEMGGRIFTAYDKTDNYPFFYTQTGVKPALIGMLGAWLSGGVEWNIPDHHRATTYLPTNYKMVENADGSKTIWVGETDLRHRIKWSVGVSVHPERSWVTSDVKVFNPTEMMQSMLYWANVSVHCGDDYQVIFPPDVETGVDHHKVYFTHWPEGPISGMGGGDVMDQSWWTNFKDNSRSIFAWGSDMEFLAGYDYGKDAGTVHVANRHQVPGKKFFLWGNNPNGHMWNKILSDSDGHYLELMVGAYSDNQPDYSWLNPGDAREFSQTWYPIKGIKGVKNATVEGAVNFEPDPDHAGNYRLGYNATTTRKGAKVVVRADRGNDNVETIFEKVIDIDPDNFFFESVAIPAGLEPQQLYTALLDNEGNTLVDYTPVKLKNEPLPKVIDGTKPVKDYETVEELYLAGLRVDQFNNARLRYMDFYEEALRRDSMDARVNIEVGKHYMRQGEWDKAEKHLKRAQGRMSHDYTRVKDAEALYYLGSLYDMTGRDGEAEDALWAATWTPDFKHPAYVLLAKRAARQGDYDKALKLVNEALYVGGRDVNALATKAYILRKLGRKAEAKATLEYIKSIDPLDYMSDAELSQLEKGDASFLAPSMPQRTQDMVAVQELLEVVNQYIALGANAEAMALLDAADAVGEPFVSSPMISYYKGWLALQAKDSAQADAAIAAADMRNHVNQYPLRIEEVALFEDLIGQQPNNAKLHYHLGNLLHYIGQRDRSLDEWKLSAQLDPTFAQAQRNVGYALGLKGDNDEAIAYYEAAIVDNPDDAVLLTESDKIWEKAGRPAADRQKRLEKRMKTVLRHDDAVMRLLDLYNQNGQYDKAIALMDGRHFHLWEGGGYIHTIFVNAHTLKGMDLLAKKQYKKAVEQFETASTFPANLEVAPNTRGNNDAMLYYLEAQAYKGMGNAAKANELLAQSADAKTSEYGLSSLRYYKARALQELGRTAEADKVIADMEETVKKSRSNLMDSYAKFGEADSNVQESNLQYFEGLVALLRGNDAAARGNFQKAVDLYKGNIWAKQMLKTAK